MRTHVDFRLPDFLEALHPDLLVRYLERFQEEYESTQRQARSKQVQEAIGHLQANRVAPAHRKLANAASSSAILGALLEGPLKCVNDLNCPRGRAVLMRAFMENGIPIRRGTDPVTAGMVMMLDHPEVFSATIAIFAVEQTEDWRLFRGAEPQAVDVSRQDVAALAEDFSEELKTHGLSGKCIGQIYRQAERVIIELAHERYVEALRTFRGRQIQVDWQRPVQHARLAYRPSTGLLKVKVFRNDEDLIEPLLRSMGARLFSWEGHFLGEEALQLNLDVLRAQPDLSGSQADHLESVQVIGLQFELNGRNAATATFEAPCALDLYTMMSDLNVGPEIMAVHQARLRFKFSGRNNKGQRTIVLTRPNTTNLGEDDYDRVIEQYLIRWGVLNGPEAPEEDFGPDRQARDASLAMDHPGGLFAGVY